MGEKQSGRSLSHTMSAIDRASGGCRIPERSPWLALTILLLLPSSMFDCHAWKLSGDAATTRRDWFRTLTSATTTAAAVLATVAGASSTLVSTAIPPASAAPPIAVIAEELGYFPAKNREGQTVFVPKRVQRESSPQAIALAKHLRDTQAKVYEAYWCPHSARQREVFGREAWALLDRVECSPKGYGAQPALCASAGVEGYPTWKIRGKLIGGERPLSVLAEASQFAEKFDEGLERNVPPILGSSSCK